MRVTGFPYGEVSTRLECKGVQECMNIVTPTHVWNWERMNNMQRHCGKRWTAMERKGIVKHERTSCRF